MVVLEFIIFATIQGRRRRRRPSPRTDKIISFPAMMKRYFRNSDRETLLRGGGGEDGDDGPPAEG